MNKFFLMLFLFLFTLPVFCIEQDEFVNSTLNSNITKPKANLNYNYQPTTKIPIRLKPLVKFSSEKDLYEGQTLKLKVARNVVYKTGVIVKKDTIVTCKVETIIDNGMNGIPASVILGNFKIPNLDNTKIDKSYEKYGLDLSLLVFPLKWALTFLPPTGSLTNFIKGGHVKLDKNSTFTIYYYPN